MNKINEKRAIERILVPVDFSDFSLNACYFALHLSARHNAEVMLFHAFFNPMIDAMTFPDAFTYQSNLAEVFHEIEENARREIRKFQSRLKRYATLRNLKNIRILTEIAAGQPSDEIENIIRKFDPDITVIGTRGQGRRSAEVLGSVAARVIDYEGMPVLLVTRDAVLREQEQVRILYATNFDSSDYNSLESLGRILASYNIRIDCVHFTTEADQEEQERDTAKMKEMKLRFRGKYPGIPLECHIFESRDISGGLDIFVEKNNIDLIALTHKKRNLFYRLFNPSLAKKLLFKTKRPVFVFN